MDAVLPAATAHTPIGKFDGEARCTIQLRAGARNSAHMALPRLHSGAFLAHNIRMSIATAGIRLAGLDETEAIAHLSRDTIEAGLPWRWQPADIERFMRSTRHNVIVAEETALNLALPAPGTPDSPGGPCAPAAQSPPPEVRNGKVMSGFAVMGYGDNDAYLALLSVKPEWRRRTRRYSAWTRPAYAHI